MKKAMLKLIPVLIGSLIGLFVYNYFIMHDKECAKRESVEQVRIEIHNELVDFCRMLALNGLDARVACAELRLEGLK